MSSGESDGLPVPRISIDRMPICEVDGCHTRLVPGWARCSEHGGDPPAEIKSDEWGETGITVTDPSAFVWEPWE